MFSSDCDANIQHAEKNIDVSQEDLEEKKSFLEKNSLLCASVLYWVGLSEAHMFMQMYLTHCYTRR